MAQVGGDSDGPNVEVNLVPFIDLMCVCITFLLVTAVWTQISMIQMGSSLYGKKSEDAASQPPPPSEEKKIPLRLDVGTQGYRIVIADRTINIPAKGAETFDQEGLSIALKKIKEEIPQKQDVVVQVADELSYEHLIKSMDALLSAGFPEISVATGGAQ